MPRAKLGDLVTVIYDGKLETGEIFESSQETGPLKFRIGTGGVMPAFEEGVIGMELDETREIILQPEQAYGQEQKELIHTLPRSTWPPDADIRPGVVLGMSLEKDGKDHKIPAMVTDLMGDLVTINFNHPLAGKKVIFRITLKKIVPYEQEAKDVR